MAITTPEGTWPQKVTFSDLAFKFPPTNGTLLEKIGEKYTPHLLLPHIPPSSITGTGSEGGNANRLHRDVYLDSSHGACKEVDGKFLILRHYNFNVTEIVSTSRHSPISANHVVFTRHVRFANMSFLTRRFFYVR